MSQSVTVRVWVQCPLESSHAARREVADAFAAVIGAQASVAIHDTSDDQLGLAVDVMPSATPGVSSATFESLVSATCDEVMRTQRDAILTWEALAELT